MGGKKRRHDPKPKALKQKIYSRIFIIVHIFLNAIEDAMIKGISREHYHWKKQAKLTLT
ncbi:hypothetical protein RhiirC2_801557 [Rhizophagus irregularis]|uniref:Uncharacterized protein n=1 Tax=Rhizophagus irregularis TaxID=588596 RepID=A0A2N1M273_9GLOM|nr:hypothetical protein RhiirC2_801557 [Rhizophagus irregularis]